MFFWNSLAFFDDPMDVGNLNSGSSAFSKPRLNIWQFTVHKLLKPGLENFEYYFTSMRDERYQGNISCKDGLNKEWKLYGPNRSRSFWEEVARINRGTVKKTSS